MTIYLSLLIALIGLIVYALSNNAKVGQAALLINFAAHTVSFTRLP